MKIGLISDTHDNVTAIRAALEVFTERKVEHIIHLGDFIAPFAVREFLKTEIPMDAVFGNCDGEEKGIGELLKEHVRRGPWLLDLPGTNGVKAVLVHDPAKVDEELQSRARLVLHGHTHIAKIEKLRSCTIINPGECCGWVTGKRSVAILDSDSLAAEIVRIS